MTKRKVLWLAAAGILCLAVLGADQPAARQVSFTIPDFIFSSKAQFDRETDEFAQNYRSLADRLLAEFRKPGITNAGQTRIIYLLGELRAFHATTFLIENINFKDEAPEPRIHPPRWFEYPAQDALRKIGYYASGMIMDIIGSKKFDEGAVDAYANVLAAIETPRYAVMKLQDHIALGGDPDMLKHYQVVIDRIKTRFPHRSTEEVERLRKELTTP
jgi:hypothetical protein